MIETVMTYEDWEREYTKRSKKAKQKKYARIKAFVIQKAIGLLLLVCTVVICLAFPEDATPVLFLLPFGVYLLLTNKILTEDENNDRF